MSDGQNHMVRRHENRLRFPSLQSPFIVGNFIRAVFQGRDKGYEDFTLDFADVTSAFPNACVPLAGLIEHYVASENVEFERCNVPQLLERMHVFSPLRVEEHEFHKSRPLNTVWKFDSSATVNSLVTAFVDSVSRSTECKGGVLQGLEWCLNEVMDNVLQHSESGYGYAMGQIHPGARHIAICIYDSGRGIFNSLRNTAHRPETALDAITIALREGVTRDETMGQGNGMWGLQNIVANNSGILNITSGPAFYRTQSGITNTGCQVPFLNHRNHCTTVDFQVDFEKPISLPDVLGGCQPVNLRIENLEDHRDNIIYPLTSMAAGTGTRRAGAEVRNDVVNIAAETSARIVLDFGGLGVVSSSFADEFVGKLVAKWGIETFQDRFRIVGTNQTVETIINRSVAKRLQQVSQGIANTAHLPPKTPIDDK